MGADVACLVSTALTGALPLTYGTRQERFRSRTAGKTLSQGSSAGSDEDCVPGHDRGLC